MKKRHPRNIDLMREAIRLAYGPSGEGEARVITGRSNGVVRKFYQRHLTVCAGPMQIAVKNHYNLGDPSVRVPKRVQRLFMEADGILGDIARRAAEREDRLIESLRKERER